ncbi:hypothetical protein Nos7524_5657 (plasmid) [Nostoc sp. PCC 7524]|nr:hypothetical protein Nos7524_5657 [Nostoc sp. PCC 7524]
MMIIARFSPCFQLFFLSFPALVSPALASGVSLLLLCLWLRRLSPLALACWSGVRLVSMRFSVRPSRLLRCSRFLLVCGVWVVVLSRLGLWRVSVPLLLVVACGFRSPVPPARLASFPLVLSRAVFPAAALGLGLLLRLPLGLVCLASFSWGRCLFRLAGVCFLCLA